MLLFPQPSTFNPIVAWLLLHLILTGGRCLLHQPCALDTRWKPGLFLLYIVPNIALSPRRSIPPIVSFPREGACANQHLLSSALLCMPWNSSIQLSLIVLVPANEARVRPAWSTDAPKARMGRLGCQSFPSLLQVNRPVTQCHVGTMACSFTQPQHQSDMTHRRGGCRNGGRRQQLCCAPLKQGA